MKHDSRNLLSTIMYVSGNIDTRTYDAGGRLSTETLGNGQVVNRTYLTGDNLPLAISNSAVGDYTYAWDANKNKTSETITGAMAPYTSTMAFDDQNRQTTWNRTNGNSQTWTLSAVNDWNSFSNNGSAVARTHGPTHEVLTVGTATITHDSRGNMTTDEFAITRTYDINNKVKQAVVPAGSSRGIVGTHSYMYDALGRRVRRSVGGGANTVYVHDGQTVVGGANTIFVSLGHDLIADYLAGGLPASTQRNYIYTGRIDEPVAMIDYTASGSLGAGVAETFYYHTDANWHVRGLTTSAGTAYEAYAYSSYGTPTILDPTSGTVRTSSLINNRWMFTAREWDQETKTYHFLCRTFGPKVNRFLGRDPAGYPDGPQAYASYFVANLVDPFGLQYIYPGVYPIDGSSPPVVPGEYPRAYASMSIQNISCDGRLHRERHCDLQRGEAAKGGERGE